MIAEIYGSTGSDDSIDAELHYEIKCRAYNCSEGRRNAVACDDLRDELAALPMQFPRFRRTPMVRVEIPEPSERRGFI